MDKHEIRDPLDAGDRGYVADEIEIEAVIQCRVDSICGTDQQECLAVPGGFDDPLCGKIGAGAWPVLDDEWLTHLFREPLPNQARDDVTGAARGIPDDQA